MQAIHDKLYMQIPAVWRSTGGVKLLVIPVTTVYLSNTHGGRARQWLQERL